MLTWLQASYGVGKAAALALASPVLDLSRRLQRLEESDERRRPGARAWPGREPGLVPVIR